MPPSDVLSVTHDDAVATVWLDRPEARNALGPAFWADLPLVMAELSGEEESRVVVLAARGPCFSVGLDLKTMPLGGGALLAASGQASGPSSPAARALRMRQEALRLQAAVSSLERCPKPVIAAIHGYCIGGGVDLATACDIRLASADAIFSVRETRMAIVADLGTLQRLPGIVGRGHVAELAYTGKDVTATRAAEIGLVNHVLPDREALWAAAAALAAEVAANSPLAVQGTKAVLRASAGRSVDQGLDYVAAWNAAFLSSDDLHEALTAFSQKRPPRFTGS